MGLFSCAAKYGEIQPGVVGNTGNAHALCLFTYFTFQIIHFVCSEVLTFRLKFLKNNEINVILIFYCL